MEESKVQYPARITMLDAIALDSEVFNILKLQVNRLLQIMPPWFISKIELQLDLVLHFIMWKLSIDKHHGSFGQQLLNVKYHKDDFTAYKGYLLCLGKLLNVYFNHNSSLFAASINSRELAKNCSTILSGLELINLLWFFRGGKYPSLSDRILRLRPVCIVNQPREVGYKYMVRELIWHGFIELAGFTLSVVNYQYLKTFLWRLLLHRRRKIASSKMKPVSYTDKTVCSICNEAPVLPQHVGCSHVFCYYCIQSNRLVDPKFECPSCGFYQSEICNVTV